VNGYVKEPNMFPSYETEKITHNFVDDTTMAEILNKSVVSSMQLFVDELVQQGTEVGMIVNGRKTKKILFGSIREDPPLLATLKGTPVHLYTCRTRYDI